MKFILDFDHTLYDTDKLVKDLIPLREDTVTVSESMWDELDARAYFYPDSLEFLQSLELEDVSILTAVTPSLGDEAEAFQKRKVIDSGADRLVSKVVFMVGDKGPYVKEEVSGLDEKVVFIDDKLEHLESVKAHCPEVICLQMMRSMPTERVNEFDKTELSERNDIPVVSNFSEVKKIVKQYE